VFIREKCSQSLEFTGQCIRKIYFGSKNQDGLNSYVKVWQVYGNLQVPVQHHGVNKSETLNLAFIAVLNQSLQKHLREK
jgi:hypothetical protein